MVNIQPGFMTKLVILTSTLPILHSVPYGPTYGVYILQLTRYARCCLHYGNLRYYHRQLVDRLLLQGYKVLRHEKLVKEFYGRFQDIIEKYQRSVREIVRSHDSLILHPARFQSHFDCFTWTVTWICQYFISDC